MTNPKPTKSAAPVAGAPLTSKVETRQISPDEAGLRVDRWFKRHFPELPHGRLEKLLRTGQVRVSGARVKAADRLASGAEVRIPPLGPAPERTAPRVPPAIDPEEAAALRETKRLMKLGLAEQVAQRMTVEFQAFGERLQSPEAHEAFAAFMARRAPDFSQFD